MMSGNSGSEQFCGRTMEIMKVELWNLRSLITAHIHGKVMFPYGLSVCLSVWAITFECLDIETSFLA